MTTERIEIVVSENGSRVVKKNLEEIGKGATTAGIGVDSLKKNLDNLSAKNNLVNNSIAALKTSFDQLSQASNLSKTQINAFNKEISNVQKSAVAAQGEVTKLEKGVASLGKETNQTKENILNLNNVLGAISAAVVGTQLKNYADEYTNLQNRIVSSTKTQEEAAAVSEKLFEIANNSRTPIKDTAELYARLAFGAKNLGLSQQEVLDITETFNKALQTSGAKAAEASGAILQFSQGFGAGVLRGEELNSVIEQTPLIAELIAKELGTTTSQLKKFGEEGKITSDKVAAAFRNAKTEVADRFGKSIPTIAQAFTVLNNQVTRSVGQFDAFLGISRALNKLILEVAINFNNLARYALAAALAIGTILAAKAIPLAINGVKALTAAIAANPFGALAIAIIAVTSYLVAFSDQILVSSQGLANLQDFAKAVFENIGAAIQPFVEKFKAAMETIAQVFGTTFGNFEFVDFLRVSAQTIDTVIGLFQGLFNATSVIFQQLPTVISEYFKAGVNLLISIVESAINAVINKFNSILESIRNLPTTISELFNQGMTLAKEYVAIGIEFIGKTFEDIVTFLKDLPDKIADLFKQAMAAASQKVEDGVTLISKAYEKIVEAFKNLPAAIAEIFRNAMNKAIELVEAGIQKIVNAINSVSEFLGSGKLANVSLGRLESNASAAAAELGKGISKGFEEGLNNKPVEKALDNTLKRAEEIAADRIKREEAEQKKLQDARDRLTKPGTASPKPKDDKKGGGGGGGSEVSFSTILSDLAKEGELLKLNTREREVQLEILRAEDQLKRSLTETEKEALTSQVQLNQSLKDQATAYQEIKAPLEEYKNSLAALNALLAQGRISSDEYAVATQNVKINYLNTQTDFGSGFQRTMLQLNQTASDGATQIERALTGAFRGAEDAFVKFVQTGKFDFKSLANSIIADLARIAFQQAIVKPLTSLFGFGGGGGLPLPITASAKGNVFSGGNVIPFAKGGIVNSPTLFPMKNGVGLMGEAGKEAIVPLARGSNGELGIKSFTNNRSASGSKIVNFQPNITINSTNNGGNEKDTSNQNAEAGKQVVDQLKVIVTELIIKEKRNGGLLAS